jgi:hypothetical protein
MPPQFPSPWTETDFEAAVHAADATVWRANKRGRQAELASSELLKKPRGDPFPFQSEEDTLNDLLKAITACTSHRSPLFTFRDDPRRVAAWVRDSINAFGKDQYERGVRAGSAGAEPKLRPEVAEKAINLMGQLSQLLTES